VPAVEVVDLKKAYGPIQAVAGISFEVGTGEVVALLGPNGAGKTTTVEILEGYRMPDSGRVSVLGSDHIDRDVKQRIGIVTQTSGIDDELTAGEVLAHFATFYRNSRSSSDLIDLVGLPTQVRIKHLSGGQRRRLDLALALVGSPELLFLDEPTTGFDPEARRDAWDLIADLRSGGATVLLTTHYLDEAQRLADRVVVINHGRIVAEGQPDTLGGRDVAEAVVSFRPPPGVDLSAFPVSASRTATGFIEIATTQPTSVLYALSGWATARGEELEALTVTRPSLEDTYLRLLEQS